jgi:hypothetical protein
MRIDDPNIIAAHAKSTFLTSTSLNISPSIPETKIGTSNQKSKPLVSHTSRSCHLSSARKCVCVKKEIEPSKTTPSTRNREVMPCTAVRNATAPLCFFPFFHHVFFMSSFMLPFILASISRSSVLVSTKNICQLPIPHAKETSR